MTCSSCICVITETTTNIGENDKNCGPTTPMGASSDGKDESMIAADDRSMVSSEGNDGGEDIRDRTDGAELLMTEAFCVFWRVVCLSEAVLWAVMLCI